MYLLSSRHKHCDVVTIEQDLVQFSNLSSFRGILTVSMRRGEGGELEE